MSNPDPQRYLNVWFPTAPEDHHGEENQHTNAPEPLELNSFYLLETSMDNLAEMYSRVTSHACVCGHGQF